MPLALLGVLAIGGFVAWTALAASGPPTPTITSAPANPTKATTATFNYTSAGATSFRCKLDSAAQFQPCGPTSTTYSSLAAGPHTFQVQAIDKQGRTSSPASYSWIIDTTAPTAAGVSIATVGASPTNATSVSWTVTFGESVTGAAAANFSLASTGLSGTPAITAVTGAGTTRTVTASTGSGTPSGSGTLQLRLSSAAAITDLAGNALGGALPVSSATRTIDRLAPPVAFGSKPPDPNSVSTSTFTWSSTPRADDFDHYECSTENGAFSRIVASEGGPEKPCGSPLTYVVATTNNGQHQFDVRAYDQLGNFTQISYSWKVAAGSIQNFTMSGNLATGDLLYPGGATRAIPVTFRNPNSVAITVTAFTISVDPSTLPSGCQSSWFTVTQSTFSTGVSVPANGSTTLPAAGATTPTIRMTDSGTNQNACRNATFTLSYTDGSAHS